MGTDGGIGPKLCGGGGDETAFTAAAPPLIDSSRILEASIIWVYKLAPDAPGAAGGGLTGCTFWRA
jgi:hypothetical protein